MTTAPDRRRGVGFCMQQIEADAMVDTEVITTQDTSVEGGDSVPVYSAVTFCLTAAWVASMAD